VPECDPEISTMRRLRPRGLVQVMTKIACGLRQGKKSLIFQEIFSFPFFMQHCKAFAKLDKIKM
jgi:hypothetical protein